MKVFKGEDLIEFLKCAADNISRDWQSALADAGEDLNGYYDWRDRRVGNCAYEDDPETKRRMLLEYAAELEEAGDAD